MLQQLWIEEYAQELSLKGKLHFCLKEENGSTQEINTECYRFGTTLNSQTLEHAEIKEVQNIQKIVIFENKANYISAPYKDGILYLFSHGYFSPKECRFLKQLHQVLKIRHPVKCNIFTAEIWITVESKFFSIYAKQSFRS